MLGHRPEETIRNQPVLRRLEFCNWDFSIDPHGHINLPLQAFCYFYMSFCYWNDGPCMDLVFCIFKGKNSDKRHKSAKAKFIRKKESTPGRYPSRHLRLG